MYIRHSLSYAVRNFYLNWLTFLEAMTDVLGVHFLSGHTVYNYIATKELGTVRPILSRDVYCLLTSAGLLISVVIGTAYCLVGGLA